MGAIIDFLVNNYLIFLLVALVLIFALVGYMVEARRKELGIDSSRPKRNSNENFDTESLKENLGNVHLNEALHVKEENKEAPEQSESVEVPQVEQPQVEATPQPVQPNNTVPEELTDSSNTLGDTISVKKKD